MKKEKTLNELRQVKEYGWKPEPIEDVVKTFKDDEYAIQNEINIKQDQVAEKLDMILDLEDIIQTEMVKAGLLECASTRNASLFSHCSAILDSKAWGS